MAALSRLVCLLTYVSLVLANTEKIVFKGPRTINVPSQHPTINDLQLDVLAPAQPSIRTRLRAAFPSESSARGPSTWFLLDDLKPGQRYEVRVCWAATQPTAFHLKAIPVPLVWDTPELITSLWDYSTSRLQEAGDAEQKTQPKEKKADREASVLFLQVSAAADYYTTDAKLMENVPPVDVDVILDPYILNILPQSMVPTICYVIVISTIAWLVAQQIAGWLRRVALSGADKEKKTQ